MLNIYQQIKQRRTYNAANNDRDSRLGNEGSTCQQLTT